jgi:hypothetical protein
MRNFLRTHKCALLFSALIALCAGPADSACAACDRHCVSLHSVSASTTNITTSTRIQEVVDGHWTHASTFLYKYENVPTAMMPVNERFYVIPHFCSAPMLLAL